MHATKLELVAEDCNQEFFIADLNGTALLRVLRSEAVSARLQNETRLDEAVKGQTLLSHWIKTVDERLTELWRQPIAHL